MMRTLLLIGLLLPLNIVQLRASCFKDCGCGFTVGIYHRSCSSEGQCDCHVAECTKHYWGAAMCWDEYDRFIDRCVSGEDDCECDSVWNHQCGIC